MGIKRLLLLCFSILLFLQISMEAHAKSDTYLSSEVQEYCKEIGNEYGICPELLMAIIERESGGDAYAKNGSCKGLMQISERWHKDRMQRLGVEDIYDEYGNILLGADYLMELADKHKDVGTVLMVYHGESNIREGVLSKYAEGILERAAELEMIHERKAQ